jgi:hypothetical protein
MSRFVLALLPIVALAGCSHGTKQVRPKPTACERARSTALEKTPHDVLRGDVDGDGVPDSVALVDVRGAPRRCGAFIVVRTNHRTLTRPLEKPDLPVPALNGLAALVPGRLHIVVTTWEGASTAFARILAVHGEQISPLATGVRDIGAADETFPYEGSVTHFNAVDCVGPGTVVASGWFMKGGGPLFGFERRYYHVGKSRFLLVRTQTGTTRTPLPPQGHRSAFREPQPFPSCMRVRAG